MNKSEALRARLAELEVRNWNLPEIEARFIHLAQEDIPKKASSQEETVRQRQDILDRVQRRGEEYCYLTRNCAKGSTLALLPVEPECLTVFWKS